MSRRVKLKLATVSQDDNRFYAGPPTTIINSSLRSSLDDIKTYAIVQKSIKLVLKRIQEYYKEY